jgi:hypothetical protein
LDGQVGKRPPDARLHAAVVELLDQRQRAEQSPTCFAKLTAPHGDDGKQLECPGLASRSPSAA